MQHTFLNLLSSSLVPELGPDVTAGPPGHTHGILVMIFAIWAFPNQFAALICHDLHFPIITASAAVIAFRIQLRIHNILINMLHYRKYRRNVIFHIRNFHIADSPAGRKGLKLALKI